MTAPTMPVLPGFTAVQHLGSGGYADVYLYEQHAPKRRVAIKVLRDQALSPKLVDQFTSEANAMAELAHPHIVPVLGRSSPGWASLHRDDVLPATQPGRAVRHRAVRRQ